MARPRMGYVLLGVVLAAACSRQQGEPGGDAGSPGGPGDSGSSGVPTDAGALPDGGPDAGGTDGGLGDGGVANACSGLLGAQDDAGVFTPPPEFFLQADRLIATCLPAGSDGLGSLAFLTQQGGTEGRDGRGDAFVYVLDPAMNELLTTRLDGGPGLWRVSIAGDDKGFVALLSVLDPGRFAATWFDPQGRPTATVERPRTVTQGLLDDGHGDVVAAFHGYDDLVPLLRLEAYGPDGGLRWADSFPSLVRLVGIDRQRRTLLSLELADAGTALFWVDTTGDAGTPFPVPSYDLVYPLSVPRLEGGFFLGVQNDGLPQAHWIGALPSGTTTVEPVPTWLDDVDPLRLVASPTGHSYVVLSLTPRGVDGFEVRSPDGQRCARVELPIRPPPGNAFDVSLGRDGTVFRTFLTGCLPDAGQPFCPCGWEYWPRLLR